MRSIEVRFSHRSERPKLPEAVYDEIADALVAEAERMASAGSSPSSGTSLMGADADAAEVEREDRCTRPKGCVGTREKNEEAESTPPRRLPREASNKRCRSATPPC